MFGCQELQIQKCVLPVNVGNGRIMARPTKQGIDYFPVWNPQRSTLNRINSLDYKTRIKALRNSSGAFIKREDVRRCVLKKCKNKCIKCGSLNNLQVDHLVSVHLSAKIPSLIDTLNTIGNLQILCLFCNSSKSPGEI